MASGRRYAQALAWVDIETTGLPNGNDFSDVHILEVAVLVTDFDLQPLGGYHEAVKLTRAGADALRGNPEVLGMHRKNGLIVDSKNSEFTLADVEKEIIKLLKETTSFDKGEFMIAGSGVAAFDFPLIKDKMPEFASWLAYYPFDIGIMRRTARILSGGKDIVNPTVKSFGAEKLHRAWEDVKAHVDEAKEYQAWFRSVT